jgi:OOP family OmpA-OmpF porin
VLLVAFGWSIYAPIRNHLHWREYLEKLNAAKGIVVTAAEKRNGKYVVFGLRDPLAVDPRTMLEQTRIDPTRVLHVWEPYQALQPEFILKRAVEILNPPKTVSLKLQDKTLVAEGLASHQWILTAKELARTVPGIDQYRENVLVDNDSSRLDSLIEYLQGQSLFFPVGFSDLEEKQLAQLKALVPRIQELERLTQLSGKSYHIQIVGHTDQSGTEPVNARLRRERADNVRAFFLSNGIEPCRLAVLSSGQREPRGAELSEKDRQLSRRVTFNVVVTEVSGRGID